MTRHALALSSSATRMRRHRERLKHGSIFVRFEMAPAAIDRLIELRWLSSDSRHNPYAVTVSLIKFGTQALWPDQ
jgi:hypothetical protein